MTLRSVGIVGTGSYLPETIVTNYDFHNTIETDHEWIVSRTGIEERRKVSSDQAASDLGAEAGRKALADAGISAEEVDLIILATVTPDMLFPATACIIQEKIGAKKAAAIDIEAACSGFLYGLAIGSQFIQTGMYDTVLVISSEVLSNVLNYEDRNTCVLFGDGAGAAVLRPVAEGEGILSFHLGSDGSGAELLKIPAGGSKQPTSLETIKNRLHTIQMSGNDVFKFAVRVMGEASIKVLEKAGLSKEDVDFLVPHQANVRIVDAALKRLGLNNDKVYVNLNKYGNMSGASIPVALDEALKEGKIKKGDIVVLVGFGAGLTWGSCAIRW